MVIWTEHRLTRLKLLHNDGLYASVLARKLGFAPALETTAHDALRLLAYPLRPGELRNSDP
jgi:hypothetical protein